MKTLYDALQGTDNTSAQASQPAPQFNFSTLNGKDFAQAILDSREFREYIRVGMLVGNLSSAIVCRLMDYAWGKPPDRIEHTGRDGQPIVTEVRRIVVHASPEIDDSAEEQKQTTH